jgi:hypothetical protein
VRYSYHFGKNINNITILVTVVYKKRKEEKTGDLYLYNNFYIYIYIYIYIYRKFRIIFRYAGTAIIMGLFINFYFSMGLYAEIAIILGLFISFYFSTGLNVILVFCRGNSERPFKLMTFDHLIDVQNRINMMPIFNTRLE